MLLDRGPRFDPLELCSQGTFGYFRFVRRLARVTVGQTEKTAQAQVGVCGNGTLAPYNITDALISLASRYRLIPNGVRNSSSKSSPGVTGFGLRIGFSFG